MLEGRLYGKNRIGPMGHHWLVALFVLSAKVALSYNSSFEQGVEGDLIHLKDVTAAIRSSQISDYNAIIARFGTLDADHEDIQDAISQLDMDYENLTSWLADIYYLINGFTVTRDGQKFVRSYDPGVESKIQSLIDLISASREYSHASGSYRYHFLTSDPATRQVLTNLYGKFNSTLEYAGSGKNYVMVTNSAETVMLQSIYQALTNKALFASSVYTNYFIPTDTSFFIPMNEGTTWIRSNVNDYYDTMKQYYEYLSTGHPSAKTYFETIMLKYGSWRWDLLKTLALINTDNSTWIMNNELGSSRFNTRVKALLINPTDSSASKFLLTYRDNYYNQYAVLPFRNMVSNFLYSAYHNGTLDPKILAQLANPDEVNALVSSSQVSNSIGNVVGALKDTGLVGTNDVYTGTYETNGVLAEISTNDYHNSGYSSFANNMSSNAIASKITSFNFDQKFEEGLKPFLDEISAGSGSDWIINFGNITLGDFSYTIPAVTLQRNTVYLSYVDRAFNIMKAISTVCFFLLLWNTLVAASKDG